MAEINRNGHVMIRKKIIATTELKEKTYTRQKLFTSVLKRTTGQLLAEIFCLKIRVKNCEWVGLAFLKSYEYCSSQVVME